MVPGFDIKISKNMTLDKLQQLLEYLKYSKKKWYISIIILARKF